MVSEGQVCFFVKKKAGNMVGKISNITYHLEICSRRKNTGRQQGVWEYWNTFCSHQCLISH